MKVNKSISGVAVSILVTLLFQCKESGKQLDQLKGVVSYTKGEVTLEHNGQISKATIRSTVERGDKLRTGINSVLIVQFENLGVVKLLSNTDLDVVNLEKGGNLELRNNEGNVFSKIVSLNQNQKYRVSTPTAVAGVRGTEFLTRYIDGSTKIFVKEGRVAVGDSVKQLEKNEEEIQKAKEENRPVTITESIVQAGEVAEVAKKAEAVQLTKQSAVEKINVEKTSLGTELLKNITTMTEQDLQKKQTEINTNIAGQNRKLERQIMNVENKSRAEVILVMKDGSKLRGHILSQDENIIKLDDGLDTLQIEKKEIIRREPVVK